MLSKKSKSVIVLACICCVSIGFCAETEAQADPYQNTSILVEAYVVRVSTQALNESGLPLSKSPQNLITTIISCLADPEKAQMFTGAKVMVGHEREAQVSDRNTMFIPMTRGSSVNYEAHDNGSVLEAFAYIKPDKMIGLKYSFSTSFADESKKSNALPEIYSLDWSGMLTTHTGTPVIAGAVQNNQNSTFLILCATIQDH